MVTLEEGELDVKVCQMEKVVIALKKLGCEQVINEIIALRCDG